MHDLSMGSLNNLKVRDQEPQFVDHDMLANLNEQALLIVISYPFCQTSGNLSS